MSDSPSESPAAVALRDVRYTYPSGVRAVDIPLFSVAAGERIFLEGPSGSGKSTLLSLIAGITAPQAGSVSVLGTDLATLSAAKKDQFRADHLGVIFQLFNLLPYLSIRENVLLPCRFSAVRARAAGPSRAAAETMLDRLGLGPMTSQNRAVRDLSVGQQQRVAAARALIGSPGLVLADEPTSAMDAGNQQAFLDLLLEETARTNAALIFVSHDTRLAGRFDRQLSLLEINRAQQEAVQ